MIRKLEISVIDPEKALELLKNPEVLLSLGKIVSSSTEYAPPSVSCSEHQELSQPPAVSLATGLNKG
jgi:hypothetical protein